MIFKVLILVNCCVTGVEMVVALEGWLWQLWCLKRGRGGGGEGGCGILGFCSGSNFVSSQREKRKRREKIVFYFL